MRLENSFRTSSSRASFCSNSSAGTSARRSSWSTPLALVAVALSVAACSAKGRTVEPDSTDAGSSAGDDAGAAGPSDSKDAGGFLDAAGATDCERDLEVGLLSVSNAACYVNTQVESKTSKLEFPCAGGAATVTFGTQTFTGKVNGDLVHLKNVETFNYGGCPWESTQTIDGDVTTGSLDYSYTEKPLTTCPDQYPCTANGSLAAEGGPVTPK